MVVSLLVYITIYSCTPTSSDQYKDESHAQELERAELITGTLFSCYSFFFGITGALILKRLKKYFLDFYNENKNMILFATLGLMFSLLIRGILDLTKYQERANKEFNMEMADFENVYNGVTLLVCDIIPIMFQLSTLIFGYIRKRNDKRYRLEVERRKELTESEDGHTQSRESYYN